VRQKEVGAKEAKERVTEKVWKRSAYLEVVASSESTEAGQ